MTATKIEKVENSQGASYICSQDPVKRKKEAGMVLFFHLDGTGPADNLYVEAFYCQGGENVLDPRPTASSTNGVLYESTLDLTSIDLRPHGEKLLYFRLTDENTHLDSDGTSETRFILVNMC